LKNSAYENISKIKNLLWWKHQQYLVKLVACSLGALFLTKALWGSYQKYRFIQEQITLRHQVVMLIEEDKKVSLPNCPEFVRTPEKEQVDVKMNSYKCARCNQARGVINIPCEHCYLCYECFVKKEDKFACNYCDKTVEKVMRIYVTSHDVD
jgi:hypothetical protein